MLNALINPVLSTLGATTPEAGFWLPPQFSEQAELVDAPFMFITIVCIVNFIGVMALMIYFMVRYNRDLGAKHDPNAVTHLTWLEVTWSVIPLIFVIVMFYLGFKHYMNLQVAPADAYTVNVTAWQWNWSFQYHTGHSSPDLHVPANRPVKLVMNSKDVIHSFFVPDFRVKMDVVPGKFSSVWFEAKYVQPPDDESAPNPNEHHLFCAEYCGTDHSNMIAKVVVHETQESFEQWLAEDANPYDKGWPMHAIGDRFALRLGCINCHSIDGAPDTGPTWKGIWSRTVNEQTRFADGSQLDLDNYGGEPLNYFLESIWEPGVHVVEGFPNSMSTFKSQLSQQDVAAIVEYFKWLEENSGHPYQELMEQQQ